MKKNNCFFDFTNKKILILGSSGGIGTILVKHFIKFNAKVIGISRSKKNSLKHKNFTLIQHNLLNYDELDEKIRIIIKKTKKIDVLVNCFGMTKKSIDDLQNIEDFALTINNNLISYYNFIYKFSKFINNNASIINITSIASNLAFEKNPGYLASKGALSALTRSLAKDLSKRQIRVNSVAPSYVKTKMTNKSYKNKKTRSNIANQNLLKRWGSLSEICYPIIFLASDGSSFINGQEIIIDGGWSINGIK